MSFPALESSPFPFPTFFPLMSKYQFIENQKQYTRCIQGKQTTGMYKMNQKEGGKPTTPSKKKKLGHNHHISNKQ